MTDERLDKYPKTEIFEVIDTIGVPHPYCITPNHMKGDHMYMDSDTIREAEKEYGACCDICRKLNNQGKSQILDYDEHKQGILLSVKSDKELKDVPGLKEYLFKIKPLIESDGFVGVAFKQVKL